MSLFTAFSGATANDLWIEAAQHVKAKGPLFTGGTKGDAREVLHATFALEDPRQRWVTARRPALNVAFALVEVIWILQGRSDSAFLTPWNSALPRFVGDREQLPGAYGWRLRKHFGLDQLHRVYDALSSNPGLRQIAFSVWDPRVDLPGEDGAAASADVPCNVFSTLKISGGRLEWLQILRSNDLFLGFPYNLVQWTTLQEVVAGWLGVELGAYHHVADSLHLYERDADLIDPSEFGDAPEPSTQDLRLSYEESVHVFSVLADQVERLATASKPDVVDGVLADSRNLPSSYRDWLLVIGSERLRRIGRRADATSVVNRAMDPTLRQLQHSWMARFDG